MERRSDGTCCGYLKLKRYLDIPWSDRESEQRLWFEMKGRRLSYSSSPGAVTKGAYPLENVRIVSTKENDSDGAYSFQLCSPSIGRRRRVVLTAATVEDRLCWMTVLSGEDERSGRETNQEFRNVTLRELAAIAKANPRAAPPAPPAVIDTATASETALLPPPIPQERADSPSAPETD